MQSDLKTLKWLLTAPNLLQNSAQTPESKIVTDEFLTMMSSRLDSLISSSNDDSLRSSLEKSLINAKTIGRLGRYMESLASFAVSNLLSPTRLESNLPIQGEGRTIGELDLLFASEAFVRPQHWELSVKFYICVAENLSEMRDTKNYLGTFVEDRLDRKIKHLFENQLALTSEPHAREKLSRDGWTLPFEDRVLMKGLFFYPSDADWQTSPLPDQISPKHERGWWTTSEPLLIPQANEDSRFIKLGQLDWLGRFSGRVRRDELLERTELEDLIRNHFSGEQTPGWLRRRELTVAEVSVDDGFDGGVDGGVDKDSEGAVSNSEFVMVKEISRGHIVHRDWPELARWAKAQSLETLESSLKEHSRRPRGRN